MTNDRHLSVAERDDLILEKLNSVEKKVDSMESRMVTKEDSKAFVTKEDAKAFATKDDLKALDGRLSNVESRMATKDDLNVLRNEMEDFRGDVQRGFEEVGERMTHKIGEVEERMTHKIGEVEERMTHKIGEVEERMTHKIGEVEKRMTETIITHVDGFVRMYDRMDCEVTSLRAKVERVEETVAVNCGK